MTNKEKIDTLFELYKEGLIDKNSLAESIKTINEALKTDREKLIEKNNNEAQATRDRLAQAERDSYLASEKQKLDSDLMEKLNFLSAKTNENGEYVYTGLIDEYNDLAMRHETNPNDEEINSKYWNLVNEVDELYNMFNKTEQIVQEPVITTENENVSEPSVGVSEIVIPDMPSENVALDNSVVQNNDKFKQAMAQSQTDNVENTPVDNTLSTENQDKNVTFDASTVQNNDKFQQAVAAEANNANTTESPVEEQENNEIENPKIDVEQEVTYNNDPEPRKKVSSISRAAEAIKNVVANNKKVAIGVAVIIGTITLGMAIPAVGGAILGGAGVAAVQEFNKGRSGK